MKNLLAKVAVATCLFAPLIASASDDHSSSLSDTDTFKFSLNALSTVTIDYSWSDMLLTKHTTIHEYDASSLAWTLTGPSGKSGSFNDAAGVATGAGTLFLGNLVAGAYALTFTGTWTAINEHDDWTLTKGTVNLIDGDRIHDRGHERNTFSAMAVTAVPEPESYAMLLAGLGLMGFIARRHPRAAA